MTDAAAAVERVERTNLQGLKDVDIDDVYLHIDTLLEQLPGPLDLYQRWERQNWSATELDFSTDLTHWGAIHPFLREQLAFSFAGFFVGEQAVTDTLAPLQLAAPDEESRWFLATQVVDEARHAYFFSRFFSEVIKPGTPLSSAIEQAWKWTRTNAYLDIFGEQGVLTTSTDAVRRNPTDYGAWVEGVTVYHLMVESILALVGQRLLLKTLRNLDLLPAFRAGFTAVTRDESRHVNYGIWALRRAVGEGYADRIQDTVDRSLRAALRIYANPERLIHIPDDIPARARQDPRDNWSFALDSLTRRLRAAGIDEGYLDDVSRRGWGYCWEAIAEYESLHGEDHPVRAWETGEIQRLIAAAS